jgi:type I restriction enzyme R subunit
MYDKVQAHWKEEIKRLVGVIGKSADDAQKHRYKKQLDFMRSVEMAVIVSEDAGEEERFARQKLDIKPHRKKMNAIDQNGHDIEYRFKDPTDKLQLVFVCAMWLTGFDAPTVSTLYLDKPIKDHSLMQTIARANRVTSHTINGVTKTNGEVVDYYNVFRNMKKALSDYALGDDQDAAPVQDKSNLFILLDDALKQGMEFCNTLQIDLKQVLETRETYNRIKLFKTFADKILEKDTYWKEFKVYENTISSLYEACKPEILTKNLYASIAAFQYLRGVVEGIIGPADIDAVKQKIGDLLDQSIVTAHGAIFPAEQKAEFQIVKKGKILDISKIDLVKLKEEFKEKEFKNIEIANLRDFIEKKLEDMLKENSTRTNFAERLQRIIDRYNAGGMTTENYFDELVKFAEDLKAEDERHVREGLSNDELELFDILKKEKMTKAEEIKVKNAAKHLLQRLVNGKPKVLIQDWFKDGQSQVRVKLAIEEVLDNDLPETYEKDLFKGKSNKLYDLVYEYASRGLKWAA